MRAFMDQDFCLDQEPARILYHNYAEQMPILDYHCHDNPQEIYEDRHYQTITQVWLGGDHYKWRVMRANGVPEEEITGSAPDRVKFRRWAETMPRLIGNPLYHWSHLELARYFGYHGILNGSTADEVYDLCNEKLASPEFGVRGLITRSGVKLLCTTDDPADTLAWHRKLAEDKTCTVQVLPAWRPDKTMNITAAGFPEYIARLSAAAGVEIRSLDDLKRALSERLAFFDSCGCRVSDHGLENVPYAPVSEEEADRILKKGLAAGGVTREEAAQYQTVLLRFLAEQYARLGWAMQIHFACLRNNNQAMFEQLGPDTGFDSVGDPMSAAALAAFLNSLGTHLPKTILYSLNPNDNTTIATILGCFQNGETNGKMQLGAAWWFNDHRDGMEKQLRDLADVGVLGNFIGMLTDSRSFLSYTRHEYFRRILCNYIGGLVESGQYPWDEAMLGGIVQDICWNNAVRYFGFSLPLIPEK